MSMNYSRYFDEDDRGNWECWWTEQTDILLADNYRAEVITTIANQRHVCSELLIRFLSANSGSYESVRIMVYQVDKINL